MLLNSHMLNFLKRIFQREQVIIKENVAFNSLNSWLDEKTAPNIAELNNKLKELNNQIHEDVNTTNQNLSALDNAELMNQNIPERAKHFMKGNREAYKKKVSLFLNSLHLPDKVDNWPVFYSAAQNEMKEMVQGTAKSFQVLQEFFANESRNVMNSIGSIESKILAFKQSFDKAGLDLLEETKVQINDLQAKIQLKKALQADLKEQKSKLSLFSDELKNLKTDIELLQKDKELNNLKIKLNACKAKSSEIKNRFITPFSVINPALRKFERITYRHRLIVQKYIESPLDALMQDLHLSILKALQDLEKAILTNRIDLKDKKKEKTLEVLKLLNKSYLGNFLTEFGNIKKEQDKLIKQIKSLDVVKLLKEKTEKSKQIEEKCADTEKKIDLFSKEIEKFNLDELEKKILSNLRKITQVDVNIV